MNNRKEIKNMIEKSRQSGFSPILFGKNKSECEKNFYLNLGLDENGNVIESKEVNTEKNKNEI